MLPSTRYSRSALLLAFVLPLLAQEQAIDTQRSTITVHVGKAGLFSFAAHEHVINAPISSGVIDEGAAPRVEFTVQTAKMTVQPDPKISASTQAEIQADMDRMTLQPEQYPEIVFRSTRVERTGDGWKVDGTLSLHGVTKPVAVDVKRTGDAYTGRASIRQTEFGIKPISLAAGSIKVKDQVVIEFQIYTR